MISFSLVIINLIYNTAIAKGYSYPICPYGFNQIRGIPDRCFLFGREMDTFPVVKKFCFDM